MTGSNSPFRVYGLTGGIASGKSKVAELFRAHGIPTVDADAIARELRAPGEPGAIAIEKRFGTLDSKKLRALIASDENARTDLEAILHPLIKQESAKRLHAIKHHAETAGTPPFALYEATLLVEAGRAADFAGVILVESTEASRLERLVERDQMETGAARQFIGAQPSLEKKKGGRHPSYPERRITRRTNRKSRRVIPIVIKRRKNVRRLIELPVTILK